METEDLLILGAVAVGGYLIYKTLGAGIAKTGDAIGDVAGSAGSLISYNLTGIENLEKGISELINKGLQPQTINNYFPSSDNQAVGATNSAGQTIGIQQGVLGLSVLNQPAKPAAKGVSWVTLTNKNTQNITKPQTASEAIEMAQNPFIKNVSIPIGNAVLVGQKPVSLPPSILSQLFIK
jgi:hypothetical protein